MLKELNDWLETKLHPHRAMRPPSPTASQHEAVRIRGIELDRLRASIEDRKKNSLPPPADESMIST